MSSRRECRALKLALRDVTRDRRSIYAIVDARLAELGLLHRKHFTLRALAAELGVNQGHVSRFVNADKRRVADSVAVHDVLVSWLRRETGRALTTTLSDDELVNELMSSGLLLYRGRKS